MNKSFYLKVALISVLIITATALVYPQISDRASASNDEITNLESETHDIQTFEGTDFDDPFGDNNTGEEKLPEEEKTEGNENEEGNPDDDENQIEKPETEEPEIGEPGTEKPEIGEPGTGELDEGEIDIENPFDGGEVELVSTEVDRNAFVTKAMGEHDELYPSSFFINPIKEIMFKEITDKIFDEKLYDFDTPENFYMYTMTRYYGCIVEIEKQYSIMSKAQHKVSTTPVSYGGALAKVGSDVTRENYIPYVSSGGNNSSSSDALVPGYINSATQEIRPIKTTVLGDEVNKYRSYELTWGIDLSGVPSSSQAGNAEIWILIDNSKSMTNNFHDAIAASKKLIDTLIPANYKEDDPEAIKIGIISFANSSRVIASPTANRNSLINALDNIGLNLIDDTGTSGTNLQEAIILLKEQMNITDETTSASSNIKKIAVIMSDGQVTTRYTDKWSDTRSPFVSADIGIQNGNKPEYGTKRWSYLIPSSWASGNTVIEKIGLPSGLANIADSAEIGPESDYVKQVAFSKEVTMLEAQFLASQGVDIHTLAYTTNDDNFQFMRRIANKLNAAPNFRIEGDYSKSVMHKAISSTGTSSGNGGNSGSYSVNSLIRTIQNKVKVNKPNYFTNYKIIGKLVPNFQFENTALVVSKQPFGVEPVSWGSLYKNYTQFTLTTPNSFTPGTYYVTGKVKCINYLLLPYGAGKETYGPSASEKINLAEQTEIHFTETGGKVRKVTVDGAKTDFCPNLNIAIETDNDLLLVGEAGIFNPIIKSGSGYYKYLIEETVNTEPKKILSQKNDLKANPTYDVNVGKIERDFVTDGNHKYTLTVEDLISGERSTKFRDVYVREGILNVNVVNESANKNKTAAFETKLKSSLEGIKQSFYLIGSGNRKFTYKTGSEMVVRGAEFDAKTYVPFGYEVTSISDTDGNRSDGKVKIDLVKNGTMVSGNDQTITIKVREKSNPKFFFDWSWVINNVKGNLER